MGRRCSAIPFCLEVMLAAVVLHSATGFQSLQLPPGGCSGASLQRARNLGRSKGPPQLSCAARESGEASGDGGGSFTGGDDLAIRMMISRNRSQRDAEERVYMPLDVAVRWARMTRAWTNEEGWREWKARHPGGSHAYIPDDPEVYYSKKGVWLGWAFWLGKDEDLS
ncbi:hypothetical protein T484DRAFT_1977462 [Baffinella frigidus]|nr:hypothetical protein T484DRAFT_1977462 [Cryptophyta sp. CCMP2293]